MSYADYNQRAEDHRCFLILVRHVGSQLTTNAFDKLYDRISSIQSVYLPEHKRTIWFRYKRLYPLENNAWGDFQAHRKVLGLICVGKCNTESDIDDVNAKYSDAVRDYADTLYNSRLLLLGADKEGNVCQSTRTKPPADFADGSISEDSEARDVIDHPLCPKHNGAIPKEHETESNELHVPIESQSLSRTSSFGSTSSTREWKHAWFYPGVEDCRNLEERIGEFASSLFWVLESKRINRSFEKKISLLCAPFEDASCYDTESRSYRRRCQGRLRKHLGDLCLLAGVPGEALLHYQTAQDNLKSVNDSLWLAGGFEGLCSASVIITYPQTESQGLHRNLSLSAKRGSNMEQTKATGIEANGLEALLPRYKSCLPADDIIEKYKEAIVNYSKFKPAGIIEMEASIKATRVLILQEKFIHASDFLQNVIYINLELPDEEKVQRYNTLATLYQQVGFYRKAGFFHRISAMQCVSLQNPRPNWIMCYHLLLQALEGYRIHLDPNEFLTEPQKGWPELQLQVLHELTFSARKMGNPALAVRHISFLLHCMHDYLTPSELEEISNTLEVHTAKCDGSPYPLAVENGPILPPVALWHLPEVRSFRLLELSYNMQPRYQGAKHLADRRRELSPFIYSPMQTRKETFGTKEACVKWVQGDICEINLVVVNPMPYELKVLNIALLTSGVEFESHPATLLLPPGNETHLVKILGTPKTVGTLHVIGYSSNVLGVKSHCQLSDIPHLKDSIKTVEVIPALPFIQVSTTLPRSRSLSNLLDGVVAPVNPSAIFKIYTGERHECQVTLSNMGKYPVTVIDVVVESNMTPETQSELFVWNSANLTTQLPLVPGGQAGFTLYMNGMGDYIEQKKVILEETMSHLPSSSSPRPRSMRTASSTPNIRLLKSSSETFPVKQNPRQSSKKVEALLKFEYTGGPGCKENFYRQCVVPLNLEILPSIMFRDWSISPNESSLQCNINTKVVNCTSHQIEVDMGTGDRLILEENESKRVSTPLDRQHIRMPFTETANCVDPVSEKIADSFDIKWKIPALEKKGKASLNQLSWLPSQAGLLKVSPLQWDVYLNGDCHKPGAQFQVILGEELRVDVTATNIADSPIEDAILSITMNPENRNSASGPLVAVINVGNNSNRVALISANTSCAHQCALLATHPGLYLLDIRCTCHTHHKELEVWRHVPNIKVEVVETP